LIKNQQNIKDKIRKKKAIKINKDPIVKDQLRKKTQLKKEKKKYQPHGPRVVNVSGFFLSFFTGRLTGHLLLDFLTKEIASVVVTAMLGFRRSEVAEKLGYGCITPKKSILSKNTIYILKNLFMTSNNPKINLKTQN